MNDVARITTDDEADGPGPGRLLSDFRALFGFHRPGDLKMLMRFLAAGRAHGAAAAPLWAPRTPALSRIMADRPEYRRCLVAPYQNATWGVPERIGRIVAHYGEVDALADDRFRFGTHDKLELLRLDDIAEGLSLILDQPHWFHLEGGFTLNLFLDDFRAFSVSFSLCPAEDGVRGAFVGGIQGRRIEGEGKDAALDLYRDLTRAAFGLRPRDLLIECLRRLLSHLGVARLLAVSDAARFHRHPFFGQRDLSLDYDTIWADRGGTQISDDVFEVPLEAPARPIEEIAAKKRSLYRKRYAFLERLDGIAAAGFPDARMVEIEAT